MKKRMAFQPSASSNGEDNQLGHFDNLTQFLLVISIVRRILGAEQSGRNPERFHFFPDSHQLLLFRPEYVVRIFHRGGPFYQNSGLVLPVETYSMPSESAAKPPGGTY